jgi:hypothetical protein
VVDVVVESAVAATMAVKSAVAAAAVVDAASSAMETWQPNIQLFYRELPYKPLSIFLNFTVI